MKDKKVYLNKKYPVAGPISGGQQAGSEGWHLLTITVHNKYLPCQVAVDFVAELADTQTLKSYYYCTSVVTFKCFVGIHIVIGLEKIVCSRQALILVFTAQTFG